MSLFEPNLCSCLDWGLPNISSNSVYGNNFNWRLCPNPQKPGRHRPPLGSSVYTGADEFRCEPDNRCAGLAHDSCTSGDHGATHDIQLLKCSQDERSLVFKQIVRSRATSPADPAWFVVINCWRSGLYDDEKMRHVVFRTNRECCTRCLVLGSLFYGRHCSIDHHRARA